MLTPFGPVLIVEIDQSEVNCLQVLVGQIDGCFVGVPLPLGRQLNGRLFDRFDQTETDFTALAIGKPIDTCFSNRQRLDKLFLRIQGRGQVT